MFDGRWRSLHYGWLIAAGIASIAQGSEITRPHAPAVDLPRLAAWLRQSPAESTVPVSAIDEISTPANLLRAALTAEGIDAARADGYVRRIAAWADELDDLSEQPRVRAMAALSLLHDRVLGRYDAQTSSLAVALDEGRYNCLGSVILFLALADKLGLQCLAVERPGHVLARLAFDGRCLDLETTCPPRIDAPPACQPVSADERELSPRALLALVYFNRGCDLLERCAFRSALAANLTALQFDPDNARARNNLLAAWNNWALALARQGDSQAAEELLTQGLELAPEYPLFADNLQAIGAQSAGIKKSGSID